MAKTKTAPWDYDNITDPVPCLAPVCLDCGGNAARLRDGLFCMSCGSTNVETVWETMLDIFRRGLAELKEAAASGKAAASHGAQSMNRVSPSAER
jgi:anaerobic ribonucleoside-triphosphate reductase